MELSRLLIDCFVEHRWATAEVGMRNALKPLATKKCDIFCVKEWGGDRKVASRRSA